MPAPTQFGREFLVPTNYTNNQALPSTTALADGKFVITWADFSGTLGDNSGAGIKAQLYGATGTPIGNEFLINQVTNTSQLYPSVASLSHGGFVVAWEDRSGQGGDTSFSGIKARILKADGSFATSEFLVNSTTLNDQGQVSVAGLSDGAFVATWHHLESGSAYDIRARFFDAGGIPFGPEFIVDDSTASEVVPKVAALSNGTYAIVWQDNGSAGETDGSGYHIRGTVFSGNGARVSNEFIVNTTTVGDQTSPDIAALPDGTFVVTWTSNGDVRARVFTNAGIGLADDFTVDDTVGVFEGESAVTALLDASYLISWNDSISPGETDGSFGHVGGAILTGASGTAVSGQFVVNSETTASDQFGSSVTVLRDGRLVATWMDLSFTPPDADGYAVRAQIYDPRTAGISLSGSALNDEWVGTAFTDRFQGGLGDDTLFGAGGRDILAGDSGHDRLYGGSGNDTGSGGLGNDWILGEAGNDLFRGGSGNDSVFGEAGKDRLYGDTGNDWIYGGLSNDIMTGGAGKDRFVFDTRPHSRTNADSITDFSTVHDRIGLENAVFNVGKVGTLSASRFHTGRTAVDGNDRVIYDPGTGALFYDRDGTGAATAVKFAQLAPNLALNHTDFFVV
jgi:Ca2+-binding RTX toxin-like protein